MRSRREPDWAAGMLPLPPEVQRALFTGEPISGSALIRQDLEPIILLAADYLHTSALNNLTLATATQVRRNPLGYLREAAAFRGLEGWSKPKAFAWAAWYVGGRALSLKIRLPDE